MLRRRNQVPAWAVERRHPSERLVLRRVLLCAVLLALPSAVQAGEIFGGVLAHDIDSPLTKGGFEKGADLQLGWRGGRIRALSVIGSPSPYVFGSLSTSGETSFAAAGLSWRIGGRLYVRPGIGVAIHDRDSFIVRPDGLRGDLGSRVLFEPELGVGYQVSDRVSVEAAWVHISQAQLFSRQNPGMDSVGVRVNFALR
jgi:lipid A 3-O-deacylase